MGGRWTSKGVAVVYASQSLALAALEVLVHLEKEDFLKHYLCNSVTIPSSLVRRLDPEQLPGRWRNFPSPLVLRAIGDQWVADQTSAVLQVPSAIIDTEWNFLLNPAHADFSQCKIGNPWPFKLDHRLFSWPA